MSVEQLELLANRTIARLAYMPRSSSRVEMKSMFFPI